MSLIAETLDSLIETSVLLRTELVFKQDEMEALRTKLVKNELKIRIKKELNRIKDVVMHLKNSVANIHENNDIYYDALFAPYKYTAYFYTDTDAGMYSLDHFEPPHTKSRNERTFDGSKAFAIAKSFLSNEAKYIELTEYMDAFLA